MLLGLPMSRALAVDYVIAATGSAYVVNHNTNVSDTLTLSEPAGAGSIRFTAPGRTFTVNGGPTTTGSTASLSLSGIGGITINAYDAGDTINVGAFSSSFPSLTINGGAGNDTANFTGNITFASGKNLTVSLQSRRLQLRRGRDQCFERRAPGRKRLGRHRPRVHPKRFYYRRRGRADAEWQPDRDGKPADHAHGGKFLGGLPGWRGDAHLGNKPRRANSEWPGRE